MHFTWDYQGHIQNSASFIDLLYRTMPEKAVKFCGTVHLILYGAILDDFAFPTPFTAE